MYEAQKLIEGVQVEYAPEQSEVENVRVSSCSTDVPHVRSRPANLKGVVACLWLP
jgi:hypothetical protein